MSGDAPSDAAGGTRKDDGAESRKPRHEKEREGTGEARLAREAMDGDRAAFGRLYERYARMVHGILLSWAPRRDVEDLAQDVFLLALRKVGTLRDEGAFGPWIARIARNRASDFHREKMPSEELPEDLADARAAGEGDALEALAALTAIRTLPEAYRETLMMRLVEGMSGPEIAARTGLTPDSVRVNLHRGMTKLRDKLGRRDA